MTRVLLVGEMTPGQLGDFCLRGLQGLDVHVDTFDMAGFPLAHWRASSTPLLPDISHWIEQRWVNANLPRRVQQIKPDIVLILGGRQFDVETLAQIKDVSKAKLANWNADSPWEPHNSSTALLASIPLYDAHFTWGNFLIEKFYRAGAKHTSYLPFAYDPIQHRPTQHAQTRDVIFAGTWEAPREDLLNHVDPTQLELWGNHWHRLAGDSPLKKAVKGVAEGDKLAPLLSSAKIALNFIRNQNGPAHNMRTYEAPACGAFMLTSRTDEQVALFGENKGAAFFSSGEELADKITYFLKNDQERTAIAQRGFDIISRGQNTYQARMQTVLDTLHSL